jgi:outer membrane receptor protein involved in Fe transport
VHFNVTLYDYKYKDLQVQFFNPVTLSQVVSNAGSLTTKGAESDFEWRPPQVQGLAFRGAVAYNKAAFHNFIGQCYGGQDVAHGCNLLPNAAGTAFNGQQFDGRTPPKAPKWGAQGGFSYDHGVTQDVTAHVTADANYSSSYNYTDTLRPDGVQKGFTRIDASLALSDEAHGWRVSLIGRNLTNRLVVTSANDMTFTGGTGTGSPLPIGVPSDMNAVVERGREFYVEVRKTF